MKKSLATFVHVSDLHLAEVDPSTGDSRLDARPPPWWPQLRWFDGYLGHHGIALRHLEDFYLGSGASPGIGPREDARLIVTGDVTATGGSGEYAFAQDFLEGQVSWSGSPIGLEQSGVLKDRSIPGNHDHWPGARVRPLRPLVMFGQPGPGFAATFPAFPAIERIPITDQVSLVVARIDSDAEVRPGFPSLTRLLARGRFVQQLRALEALWQGANPDEVRVLLLHHSRMNTKRLLGMTTSSRRALDSLIERCEVSILLTGHMHIPGGDFWRATHGGTTWDVAEARCGTTTQRDQLPLGYGSSTIEPNSLLVHRLYPTSAGQIIWGTEWFWRTQRGFVSKGDLPFRNLGRAQPIVVWPRR